jgi:hypothetical protein
LRTHPLGATITNAWSAAIVHCEGQDLRFSN